MAKQKTHRVLPGFGLSLGYTLTYLSIIVLIPLAALVAKSAELTWGEFAAAALDDRAIAAYRLTFGASLIGALINAVFGFVVAWSLVRYTFPGKKIFDAIIDIPFALPTAVSGIALTTMLAPDGWLGKPLAEIGIKGAFSPFGITVALTFIGLPFVVRTLEPAIADIEVEIEEAAAALGSNRWHTFWRVLAPALAPAWITGFALAFARAVGEYGSVVFIAGNMPYKTEIATLLIITKLEQYDLPGATAIAVVMLTISFLLLVTINGIQRIAAFYQASDSRAANKQDKEA